MALPVRPDWSRLPFLTNEKDWHLYAEFLELEDVKRLLGGQTLRCSVPVVLLHVDAMGRFAEAAGVSVEEAFVELGQGALRWVREQAWRDGAQFDVRFRGCLNEPFRIGMLDGCVLVHVPA